MVSEWCQVDDGLKKYFLKQVHLCEAEGMQDFLVEDLSIEGNNESPLLVAVKTLREDANKNARYLNRKKKISPAGGYYSSSRPSSGKLQLFLAVPQE